MGRALLALTLILVVCLVATAIAPAAPVRAQAAPTFVVNSPADVAVISGALDNGVCETVTGNGVCTLRAAIIKANHYPGGGVTILLPALPDGGVYQLTIPKGTGNDEANGDLNISASMTIKGEGWGSTTIDAVRVDTRIFFVYETGPVRIEGVTLRNGNDPSGYGGAIRAAFTSLTLDGVRITDNSGGYGGGVFMSAGDLVVMRSRIEFNEAGFGGGINCVECSIQISYSEIMNNDAAGYGGGIHFSAIATDSFVDSSLIGDNTAGISGGGIFMGAGGELGIVNSTIIRNTAENNGGGIYHSSTGTGTMLRLHNVTLADNEANLAGQNFTGGGIFNNNPLTLSVNNSILARNTRPNSSGTLLLPSDCAGTITSAGYNIITDVPAGECVVSGAYSSANPQLALTPGQNGGPTATLALLPGSPAINAGDPAGCTGWDGALLRVDQRGYPRPVVGCDLGAFEVARQVFLPLLRR